MPNHEKWSDFESIGTVTKPHKQHRKWDEVYAQFKCPFACGGIVELPEANVKNSKATKRREHLMVCDGETTTTNVLQCSPARRPSHPWAGRITARRPSNPWAGVARPVGQVTIGRA